MISLFKFIENSYRGKTFEKALPKIPPFPAPVFHCDEFSAFPNLMVEGGDGCFNVYS